MRLSIRIFRSVYLALVFASAASAIPSLGTHAKTQARQVSMEQAIESFHPESFFETFGVNGINHPLSARDTFSLEDAAMSFVQTRLNITADAAVYRAGYANDVVQHAYIRQQINGIPVANAVANVAFSKANRVVSFSSSFVKEPSTVPSVIPSISATDAISRAESTLGGTYNQHPTTLEFVAKRDGSVALTHVVQVRNDDKLMWYEAFVDAHSGEVIQVTDFVAHAAYRALPIQKQNLTQGFEILFDPQDISASRFGWHSIDGLTNTTDTSGNNAITFIDPQLQVTTLQTSAPLNFIYIQDPTQEPNLYPPNVFAACVNAFYIVNTMHDISYRYGFTEDGFNFQDNNFGLGGAGNDRVLVSVQDPTRQLAGPAFSTPADGQNGFMWLSLFDRSNPERDSAFENDIIVHEYTHGITNRMTGGGSGRCLSDLEARGLGEGWSDAFAEWTEWTNGTVIDWTSGTWVLNNMMGVRSHPYSTNATTNPLRYSDLQHLVTPGASPHPIGEVWANILHNIYAQLVALYGFSATAKTDPTTLGGNTVFLHLFIDALPIQPCNPTFLTARDAWIQADANRYGGANFCLLWKTFASRGLGVNAGNYTDDTTVPVGC